MNWKATVLALTAICAIPVAALAQETVYGEPSHSVIRPVGYGPLWDGYGADCGCGEPVGCGCGPKHGHCGPICDPCNPCHKPILCLVPNAIHKLGRSLDCLFPCRPRLNGDCSGCGTCGIPCGKAYCPRCRPRLLHHLHHRRHAGCNSCSTGCLTCSDPMPAGYGVPAGVPVPVPATEPLPTTDPFQDDAASEPAPMSSGARVRSNWKRPVSLSSQASNMHYSAKPVVRSKPIPAAASRVQQASHTTAAASPRMARPVSNQVEEAAPLPFNPLR